MDIKINPRPNLNGRDGSRDFFPRYIQIYAMKGDRITTRAGLRI